jgi:hypothetical protein
MGMNMERTRILIDLQMLVNVRMLDVSRWLRSADPGHQISLDLPLEKHIPTAQESQEAPENPDVPAETPATEVAMQRLGNSKRIALFTYWRWICLCSPSRFQCVQEFIIINLWNVFT